MSEGVLIALIAAAGGTGGIVTLIKAILDHRANKHAKEDEADDRLVSRLERRLDDAEKQIRELRRQHDIDVNNISRLVIAMASAGIEIPALIGYPINEGDKDGR